MNTTLILIAPYQSTTVMIEFLISLVLLYFFPFLSISLLLSLSTFLRLFQFHSPTVTVFFATSPGEPFFHPLGPTFAGSYTCDSKKSRKHKLLK